MAAASVTPPPREGQRLATDTHGSDPASPRRSEGGGGSGVISGPRFSWRGLEERHGFAGTLRTLGGLEERPGCAGALRTLGGLLRNDCFDRAPPRLRVRG